MPKDPKASSGKSTSESAARKSTPAKSTAAKKSTPTKATATKAAPARSAAKKKSAPAAAKAPAVKKPAAKPRKAAKKPSKAEPIELAVTTSGIADSIGDVSDGEAQRVPDDAGDESSAESMEAYRADTTSDAENGLPEIAPEAEEHEYPAQPRPEVHLERLQKILSQAGIASRRHAEEMIVAGRVMVNGQVVTQLGAKADPAHDHIRVDNKLLQGAERHRTFMLNKPKGYVTTVSDPEGRPTVADLFSKFNERLYPVGRLDFLSEGLLIMTNDGELANLLTRASSGVEKTYLVKVAGQLSAEELDKLREGVSIEKEGEGSKRVRTAPAAVRQIRPGDNPWYEIVLIEGRNREIRKMFSATGHFVEKIRRVGYGPLVLDVEPGKFRELSLEELRVLQLTAEGKMKPRRPKATALLPKEAGLPEEERKSFRAKDRKAGFSRDARPERRTGRPFAPHTDRPGAPAGGFEKRPFVRRERPFGQHAEGRSAPAPGGTFQKRPFVPRGDRPAPPPGRFEKRPFTPNRENRGFERTGRPAFNRPRPEGAGGEGPRAGKPFDRPRTGGSGPRPGFGSRPDRFGKSDNRRPPFGARPGGRPNFDAGRPPVDREPRADRPGFPDRERREALHIEEQPPRSEFRDREERSEPRERPARFDRPRFDRPKFERPQGRGPAERSGGTPPRFGGEAKKPRWVPRPGAQDRPSGPGGPGRPSGPSRFGGPARPSSSGRPIGGPGRPSTGGRPSFGARPAGRGGKPAFGSKPGGFRKPGFGGKPGGGPPRRDRG